MKGKNLKKLSILLSTALTLSVALTGCGSSTSKSSSSNSGSTASKATTFKIGCNNYLKGIYSLDILEKNANFAATSFGDNFAVVNDAGKTEQVIQNVQNLISSGVKGIVFFGIVDTVFPVVAQKCQAAKVPFVLYDHIPSDATMKTLKANPYFVGMVGEHDYDAGYPIGEYAAKAGLKKAIIITGKRGDTTHEARVKGFTDAFEKGGGKVIDVGWGCNTLSDGVQKADDLLTAHPDVDCIYGSNGDFGLGALQALKKHTNVKAKMYITDLDPGVLTGLKSGDVAAANGAHWINASFATALLQNYLEGHKIKGSDGKAPVLTVPILVLPSNQEDLYEKFWINNQPFSADELKNLTYAFNKNVSLQTFQDTLKNYSIKSRLEQKEKEGKVTADELKNVGIQ